MENNTENKAALADSERLKKIIEVLDTNPNAFSKKLGYSSHGSVYHVLNGLNSLSVGMIDRIIRAFPQISYEYLKHGTGEVILNEELKSAQMNYFNIPVMNEPHPLAEIYNIPQYLKEQNEILREQNELLRELIERGVNK